MLQADVSIQGHWLDTWLPQPALAASQKKLKETNEGECLDTDFLIGFAHTCIWTEIIGSKTHFLFVYVLINLCFKIILMVQAI